MKGIKIGIGRVSTTDQNPQRQIDAFLAEGIEPRYIYIDKATGKGGNLEKRTEYQKAKAIVRQGDTVFLDALDRLGRNSKEIEQEWRYFTEEIGCDVVVMSMPLLDTRGRSEDDPTGEMISKLVLTIFAWMAQRDYDERRRVQRAGIEAAKKRGVYTGRQPVKVDKVEFARLQHEVEAGERTHTSVMRLMDLKRTTYYKILREYQEKTGRFAKKP